MQVLRILLAALLAVVAMVAGLFAAAVVATVGLIAWVVLLFRQKQGLSQRPQTRSATPRRPSMSRDDVIEVETREVGEGRATDQNHPS